MRPIRSVLRFVIAAALMLVSVLAVASPASAAEGPVFSEPTTPFATGGARGVRYPMSVGGTYVPLPMRCGTEYRILWYAPGTAPDSLWRNLTRPTTGEVSKVATTLTINAVYSPFVGDFDGDNCDDVFWYAPGTGADAVWYFSPAGTFDSLPVTIGGNYIPVVGKWDSTVETDDILWYAPGTGAESFWSQRRTGSPAVSVRGTFDSATAPAVNGTYVPLVYDLNTIVWYAPGTGADAVWERVSIGGAVTSTSAIINGTFSAASAAGMPLFWTPSTGASQLTVYNVVKEARSNLLNLPGSLGATAVIANTPGRTGFTVLHQPGAGTDWLLFPRETPRASAVAAGGGSGIGTSCAVVGFSGLVQCWGRFAGPGLTASAYPITISGVSGATQVSTRSAFGCALVEAGGQVRCWGENRYGRLGRTTTTTRSDVAAPVTGIAGAAKVSTGDEFACALVTGTVRCWGRNDYGQLGNNSTVASSVTPVVVTGITGATDLSVGNTHACAVVPVAGRGTTPATGVKCWGNGLSGRLGNGGIVSSKVPVQATGLTDVTKVAAGTFHTCATRATGASCWGSDASGQLGNGPGFVSSNTPVVVAGLTTASASISAAYDRTCAVSTTGTLRCWGSNFEGSLGIGSTGIGSSLGLGIAPTQIGTVGIWRAVSVGDYHTCATVVTGSVQCWGRNGAGQLGLLKLSPTDEVVADFADKSVPNQMPYYGLGSPTLIRVP